MNYDPIHDRYTPSAESRFEPSNGLMLAPLHKLNSHGEHPASASTSGEMAPATTTLRRPASNLHQLLDNFPEDSTHDKPRNDSNGNGSVHCSTSSTDAALGKEPSMLAAGANNGVRFSQGSLAGNSDIPPHNTWSFKDEIMHSTELEAPKAAAANSSTSVSSNVPARLPLKDVKLCNNSLVASDSNDDKHRIKPTAMNNSNGIYAPTSVSGPAPKKTMDGLDHFGQPDGSASPSSDHDISPDSLPPDFRSISTGFKHLKKSDGEPFWRRDIQYDFLEEVFSDQLRVFTNHFPSCEVPNAANGPKLTFSELYVRTLAESSKSSRVLRERLIKDTELGVAVSKVCLLVNAGRMNTTVNFVPDMRSALRTYHLIPSLQADPNGPSRPLQDTPRLKTILKAVCEGQDHLQTLLNVLKEPAKEKPNTNVIKLIFLMSSYFQCIPYQNEDAHIESNSLADLQSLKPSSTHPNRFMEFFLNYGIYPKNRARRFLWLMYTYMETSFTEAELEQNPFNPKLIPPVEHITPEDMESFDNDTEFEINYATKMYNTRIMHLSEDSADTSPKRGHRAKRERQAVKKRSKESSSLSGQETAEAETAEIPIVIEDSVMDYETKGGNEAEPVTVIPKEKASPDRLKRRKLTQSVGTLIDDNKRPSQATSHWRNPVFPVKNLRKIRSRFAQHKQQIAVRQLDKNSPLSITQKKAVVLLSSNIVAHMVKTIPDFELKRKEISQWMYRYFQYKKSTGNGLLAMEWEDIRHDVINGIETYLYQQLGKVFITQSLDEHMYDECDPESLKRHHFYTGSEHLPGDSAPVDIGEIDVFGSGYLPSHDFDNVNERSTYEYLLLQIAQEVMSQSVHERASRVETVRFDLEAESMELTRER